MPNSTLPYFISRPATKIASLAGMANPKPTEPVVGETMAVSTPMTSPLRLNNGPPELPWLIAASVWMKSSNGVSIRLRFNALTIPELTESPMPSGLPMAKTVSPTWILSLSAQCITGS